MRTTLILNDDLLIEAKRVAAERKSNVSAVVNEALRAALFSPAKPGVAPAFALPTFRPSSAPVARSTPADFHDLLVAEDLDPYQP